MYEFLLLYNLGSNAENIIVTENNTSRTYVEILRGRDGLPGRDGVQGPRGLPGSPGNDGAPGPTSGGATYTRWGKSICASIAGTEQVYSGITAGSSHQHRGNGANYLCLVKDPQYTLRYSASGPPVKSYIYGSEYEHPIVGTHDHNVPCAVCHVTTRSAVLMIPGKTSCPASWTREYYGYLMSEYHGHYRSMYECVDRGMESLPGSSSNTNGALFYHVEAVCNVGIPCPPYNNYKEINCVVCSK